MKSCNASSAWARVTGQLNVSSVPKCSLKRCATSAMTSRVVESGAKRSGSGRGHVGWQAFAIFPNQNSMSPALRLIAVHQNVMFSTHFAVDVFHSPAASAIGPGREPRTAHEKTTIGTSFDGHAGESFPAFGHRLDTPFRRFGHHNAVRAMPRHRALDLGCEAAGIVGLV